MKIDQRTYQAYLLRLWREQTHGEWRCSLQNTRTCQIHYFASLKELFQFLGRETEDPLDEELQTWED